MLFSIMRTSFTPCNVLLYHSHKKRKDSLETRAELAVLRTYVENQAILEPILLYRASKCKQTKEQGSEDCLWTHIFTFYKIIVSFFSLLCQDANKTRSNCAIIVCNLSKKHKLTLYKTQNGEPKLWYTSPFTDVQKITLGSAMHAKLYFLNQCSNTKLTDSEK